MTPGAESSRHAQERQEIDSPALLSAAPDMARDSLKRVEKVADKRPQGWSSQVRRDILVTHVLVGKNMA